MIGVGRLSPFSTYLWMQYRHLLSIVVSNMSDASYQAHIILCELDMLALFGTRLEPAIYHSVVVPYIAWIGFL